MNKGKDVFTQYYGKKITTKLYKNNKASGTISHLMFHKEGFQGYNVNAVGLKPDKEYKVVLNDIDVDFEITFDTIKTDKQGKFQYKKRQKKFLELDKCLYDFEILIKKGEKVLLKSKELATLVVTGR